jgi:hypothetical protein
VPRSAFAAWLAVISVTVGAAVAVISTATGVVACDAGRMDLGSLAGPPDRVCFDLVRTLAQREGMVAAAATVVIVLLMVGLSRTAELVPEME